MSELAVGDFVADGSGDPCGSLADAALVAGGAEVAALAGEGEEVLLAAIRAAEAEEAGSEVAAAEEIEDHREGIGAERTHGGAMDLFIGGDEGVPGGGDDLTLSMPSGFAGGGAASAAGHCHRGEARGRRG